MKEFSFDIEASGLLDSTTIDYSKEPYQLKPDFKFHCGNIKDRKTKESFDFTCPFELVKKLQEADKIIGHNIIDYDLLALKLLTGVDYGFSLSDDFKFSGFLGEKKLQIIDTLVLSKTMKPDRFGGHSLDAWGKRLGFEKIDWRAKAIELGLISSNDKPGAEFLVYHPEMLVYCVRDVAVTEKVYTELIAEMGEDTKVWRLPYNIESYVRWIVTRQSHRGFKFDTELAIKNLKFLTEEMDKIRAKIEPLLPSKPMSQAEAKNFCPPKIQFKGQDGSLSAHMQKFLAKHNGKELDKNTVEIYGKTYKLPMPCEPICNTKPGTLTSSAPDSANIKGWLKSMGWQPTEFKERDLSVDQKKVKLTQDKYIAAVERYLKSTQTHAFKEERLEFLGVKTINEAYKLLLAKDFTNKPVKVLTSPNIAVGVDKTIDPALEVIKDKFDAVADIVTYFTYTHRKNSIAGGGFLFDEDTWGDDEVEVGYLSCDRLAVDGRIPTPADTCGAATSRFKHRSVANIPRVSSAFGKEMRAMFGVDKSKHAQMGYDFDSLEAKCEGHHTWDYEGGEEYAQLLERPKPNDIHCFDSETMFLTPQGWKKVIHITEADLVMQWCPTEFRMTFTKPYEVIIADYDGDMYHTERSGFEQLVTPNHRVVYTLETAPLDVKIETAKNLANGAYRLFIENRGTHDGKEFLSVKYKNIFYLILKFFRWDSKLKKAFLTTKNKKLVEDIIESCKHIKEKPEIIYVDGSAVVEFKQSFWTKFCTVFPDFSTLTYKLISLKRETKKWVFEVLLDLCSLYTSTGFGYYQNSDLNSVVVFQTLAFTIGVHTRLSFYNGEWKATILNELEKIYLRTERDIKKVSYQGQVGCVKVATGCVLVRRGTSIYVSGNSVMAEEMTKKVGKIVTRTNAKSVKYGVTYGAMPKKLAKMLSIDANLATQIYDAFWHKAVPLANLKKDLEREWEYDNYKQYITTIDGRKVRIKSKSALINYLLQSTGVICAKLTLILHDKYLKEEGLLIDFFKESSEGKDFCQQLIAYHDEAQLEINKKSIKWVKFNSEEECKNFKSEDGKVYSDPFKNPNDGTWWRGYCRAGELAVKAVNNAGKFFKLNVDLTAGYMLGYNWATCH